MLSYKTKRAIQQEQWLKNVHEFVAKFPSEHSKLDHYKFHDALKVLQASFHRGRLVFPSDTDYPDCKRIFNQEYESDPIFIGVVTDEMELGGLLQLARDFDLKFRVKAGGNDVAGFCTLSDGFVIDLAELNTISIANDLKTVTAGPAAHMQDIIRKVQIKDRHIVSGSCPEVTMAGYMMGGGYGFLSRQFGMNCDNCIEARIMLADGSIVVANASENSDLFWGIRGGGGGNLGILLSATFTINPISNVWGFVLKFNPSDSGKALKFCQKHIIHNPKYKDLGLQGLLVRFKGKRAGEVTKYFALMGMFMGSKEVGMQLIQPLLEYGKLIFSKVDTYEHLNELLLFTAFGRLGAIMSKFPRFAIQAGYVSRPLEATNWQEYVDLFLDNYEIDVAYTGFEFYGGKINAIPVEENAFVHRNKDVDVFTSPAWSTEKQKKVSFKMLEALHTLAYTKKYFDGDVYQNYPMRGMQDYRKAFWGAGLPRLLSLKKKFDPENLFCTEQGLIDC
jgi:hypothetical protein